MDLPISPPVEPMLAKSVPDLPVGAGMSYEPKWDGFRCIVFRDGAEVELASRGGKTLTRYFPDIVAQALAQLPPRCAVDGELVVIRRSPPGAATGVAQPRLDFELLSQRIHPAASRVRMLAETTPADFVAFDLLALGDEALVEQPYRLRRARLEQALRGVRPPVHITPTTTDVETARRWFQVFEGAGLDGLIAKPPEIPYEPGKRLMLKVKHARTADCVVAGFRWHKSGPVVGSLLLGLYGDDGLLHHVGVSASFSVARRAELLDEIADYRGAADHPWLDEAGPPEQHPPEQHPADQRPPEQHPADQRPPGQRLPGAPSRWTGAKSLAWEPLRPELVVEVAFDAMEGDRFRHPVQFVRWRPDREPRSCRYDQLERPPRFDVDRVLAGTPLEPGA